jgi:phosphatidylglycerol:prolipoprotein diacylglycerol transferase
MVALGILAGVTLAEHLNRKQGGERGSIVDVSLIVVLAGLLGARLFFVLINTSYYRDNLVEIVMIWRGGLVFFGGLVGGILGLLLAIRLHRLPVWSTIDAVAPGMALGHALGRLGCFSAGCCYGRSTDLPWAVTFTNPRSLATDVLNLPIHPTQIYSFLALAALSGYLVFRFGRRGFHGQIAALYVGIYSAFRFIVEFFRGDPRGSVDVLGVTLSTSQVTSLVLLPLAVGVYFYLRKNDFTAEVAEDKE